jgi:hypothetical protein
VSEPEGQPCVRWARGELYRHLTQSLRTRALLDAYPIDGTVSRETAQKGLDAVVDKKWFKESYLPRSVDAASSQSRWRREFG